MLDPHARLKHALDSLLDFGTAKASEVGANLKTVLITLLGAGDPDDTSAPNEEIPDVVLSVDAAVLVRPAGPSSDGAMEVTFVRRGDEATVLATREPRWQVDLDEGEVVVRGFGDNAPRIRLKPTGDVIVEAGGDILLGSDTAAKKVALAEEVEEGFQRVRDAINSAVVVSMDGGASLKASIVTLLDGLPLPPSVPTPQGPPMPIDTGSTKVKASG